MMDWAADIRIAFAARSLKREARNIPPQKVLIAAVEVPGREKDLARVLEAISRTERHQVTVAIQPMQPMGKFDNIALALAGHNLNRYDWLLITDDDIALPPDFLDRLIYFSCTYKLQFAQPAHRWLSYISYKINRRSWGTLVRQTQFVECGPITLFSKDVFSAVLPFPSSRWAWGIDILWSQMAIRRGWKMAVIDALPIRHLRPVAGSYDHKAAIAEAESLLKKHGITLSRAEIFAVNRRLA